MATSLVLTVIGEDKPGLVEALSRAVTSNDGNWLESRMSRMAGKFAGIVRVEVADGAADALMQALGELRSEGLEVSATPGGAADAAAGRTTLALDLLGTDQPGIVREISVVLARRGVNVEELITELTNAPMSGEPMFRARALLQMPAGVSAEQLRADLEEVAGNLMVDVTLAESD